MCCTTPRCAQNKKRRNPCKPQWLRAQDARARRRTHLFKADTADSSLQHGLTPEGLREGVSSARAAAAGVLRPLSVQVGPRTDKLMEVVGLRQLIGRLGVLRPRPHHELLLAHLQAITRAFVDPLLGLHAVVRVL